MSFVTPSKEFFLVLVGRRRWNSSSSCWTPSFAVGSEFLFLTLDAVEDFLLDAVVRLLKRVLVVNNLKVEQSNTWAHNQVMCIRCKR